MKTFATLSLLLFAGSSAAEYRPKEELMLVDCGIGTIPNGGSTSREMAYYSKGRNPAGGANKWVQPEMIAQVPWDGSYPWRPQGVKTKFPNGDVFQVWINPAIKDWDESKNYAGDATHTFGNGFKCWAEHGKLAFVLADGKKCTSAYICWHMPDSNPAPAPAPNPPKFISSTDYTISSKDIDVRVQGTNAEIEAWKPRNVFARIYDAIEGNQCKGQSYSIGSDCGITFDDCIFTVRDKTDALSRIMVDAIAPAVEKTRVTKKGHYNGNCPPGRPCEPGYDFEYGQYTYPKTGTVLMRVYPEGNEGAASLQARIHWNIQCSNGGFCGSFCNNNIKDIIDIASHFGGVPPLGSLLCAAC